MTKCYKVKSVRIDVHKDCYCKVEGIFVDVHMTPKQFDEVIPKKDLVSCIFHKGKYRVTNIFKNKVF